MVINFWYLSAGGPVVQAYPQEVTHQADFTEPELFDFTFSGELGEAAVIREKLQALEDEDVIEVVGAWDYATGQPVGGVGSPWFVTPEGFDTSRQRLLDGGQAPRVFI